ncbi:phosphatase PAP2 family protein [Shewanella surugensis]|uniref:undecaprenyl-diphosphate phosphatase n=1 Tax=Shewanella surugensis TaxID=212020 RepID=A0ABT0L8R6_9GAMM|nr:phosphatase PAP2 family protein [Shewanella surugensis]MCL1124025.1 phosphatase PAP2 family protein [Shewanella surugensis]
MKTSYQSYLAQSRALLKEQSRGYGIVLTFLIILDFILWKKEVNLQGFYFFNDLALILPNWFSAHLTDLGSGTLVIGLSLCFLVFRPELICRMLIAGVICAVLVTILKHYFDVLRPAAILNSLNIIGNIHFKDSFPSGHTAAVFVFAGSLYLSLNHIGIKVILLVMASLVGISRIIVGAHWPTDIVMGAIIGMFSAYLAANVCPPIWLTVKMRLLSFIAIFITLIVSEIQGEYDFPLLPSVKILRWIIIFLSLILIMRHIFLFWLIKKPKNI